MAYIITNDALKSELADLNKDYAGNSYFRDLMKGARDAYAGAQYQAYDQFKRGVTAAEFRGDIAQQGIAASGLSAQGKSEMYRLSQQDLDEAYASYQKNYMSQLGTAATTYEQNMAAIDEALNTQAGYTRRVADSAYDYMKWLYEKDADTFAKNPYYAQYAKLFESELDEDMMRNYFDMGLDMSIKDESGNLINDLGSIRGLYNLDDEGNQVLSDYGKEIYRQMFGSENIGTGLTYSDYLLRKNAKGEATDQDLYEWLAATNPYDFGKTNFGTVQNLFGLSEGKQGLDTLSDLQKSLIVDNSGFKQLYAKATKEKDVGQLDDKTIGQYKDALASLKDVYLNYGYAEKYAALEQKLDDVVNEYNSTMGTQYKKVSAEDLAKGKVAHGTQTYKLSESGQKTSSENAAISKKKEQALAKARKDMRSILDEAAQLVSNKN